MDKKHRAVFVDANDVLAGVMQGLIRPDDMPVQINLQPEIKPETLPALLGDASIMIIDHTYFPTDIAKQCKGLKHVVFLGVGPSSYMNVAELAESGMTVHIIKGYGSTSVAEFTFALMMDCAKSMARMDKGIREGAWTRTQGIELKGKTIGLIGFGDIGTEMARMCQGFGMKVTAWNRSQKTFPGVTFMSMDEVLASSDVLSLHVTLTEETAGMISREKIAKMRPGVLLVNTARGALIDDKALVEALRSGHVRHAGLDVFVKEPIPKDHPFVALPNVTLTAHSAWRTPEANSNLLGAALDHCRRIAREGK
ncbi:glycerate dehydrogenase [Deltaproteobacteria bacterium]|nr:glycerate dehydrogenase [Deltaproteobacteria bacterium]